MLSPEKSLPHFDHKTDGTDDSYLETIRCPSCAVRCQADNPSHAAKGRSATPAIR